MTSRDASEFLWVGGHPGFDLVNTEAVDASGERLELVPDWAALVDWAQEAGLIESQLGEQCRVAGQRHGADAMAWFRRLRASLRTVLESGAEAPGDLDAAVAEVPVRLRYHPDQARGAIPLDAAAPFDRLRLALAIAALDAARLDRSRIRPCASRRCVLLFHDASRNRSRRWCDMAVCGNRAKASTHYRRTRPA
jgi:predicted RNA-binding Zn ribbon-like protein